MEMLELIRAATNDDSEVNGKSDRTNYEKSAFVTEKDCTNFHAVKNNDTEAVELFSVGSSVMKSYP